jgi:hypothetical protein
MDKVFRKAVVQKQAEKNRWQNEGSGIAPTDHITSISVYSFRCFTGFPVQMGANTLYLW